MGASRAAGPKNVRQSSQNDVKIKALRLLWERLGTQSRAQRESGQPKVASDRAAGGVRTVLLRSFGRFYSNSLYFLKCMEHIWNTWVFRELGRVRAPKLGPLEAKSRAQVRSGQPDKLDRHPTAQIDGLHTLRLRAPQPDLTALGSKRTSTGAGTPLHIKGNSPNNGPPSRKILI